MTRRMGQIAGRGRAALVTAAVDATVVLLQAIQRTASVRGDGALAIDRDASPAR